MLIGDFCANCVRLIVRARGFCVKREWNFIYSMVPFDLEAGGLKINKYDYSASGKHNRQSVLSKIVTGKL